MKRCSRCVLPETHETIVFDPQGVCNICRQQEYKREKIDWAQKKKDLDQLVAAYRGQFDYDCIVPFSGGKDSTWTLYYLVTEYKLKPLVVRFNHGFLRPNLLANTQRTMQRLGVDFHEFTPSWQVVQRLMLQSFLEKGDFCWHCHTGIMAYPMWVAIRYQVPLLFWGEPSSEYTAYYTYEQPEEVDEKRFNRAVNLGIAAQDMFVRLEGAVEARDLKPYTYPPTRELRRINYRSVCLGSFIPWDVKKQAAIIQRELGWQGDEVENVPPGYTYEKIECFMQGVRDWIKYIKRGYTRPAHLASLDIRNGRLDRDGGLRLVEEYEGRRPPSLDLFLKFIGLTEAEFYEVACSHVVSPWTFEGRAIPAGRPTPDFGLWAGKPPMPREEALRQLERWRRNRAAAPQPVS